MPNKAYRGSHIVDTITPARQKAPHFGFKLI